MNRIKQVILIRKDLKMRRGKEIAQGSHASMQFLVQQIIKKSSVENDNNASVSLTLTDNEILWFRKGMAKICLRVDSEQELLKYHQQAIEIGIKSCLIQDSGRTEFHGQPTNTACAIGPDDSLQIDSITGSLVPY